MAITDLNANLLPNEKLTLVGPGRVEFTGFPVKPTTTPAAGTKGAATNAAPAVIKGGSGSAAATMGNAASTAAGKGIIWKGTGWSLGLGLGLGPMGTVALGSILLAGGYYLYKRRQNAQKLWPF